MKLQVVAKDPKGVGYQGSIETDLAELEFLKNNSLVTYQWLTRAMEAVCQKVVGEVK